MRAKKTFYPLLLRSLIMSLVFACACAVQESAKDPDDSDDAADMRTPPMCGALSTCGLSCHDLQNDPTSCGTCDRTCVIPNATAGCKKGECTIASCHDGFVDNDHQLSNGCELKSNCLAGAACQTSCESGGSTVCVNGVAQCQPPQEVCNARDDNCDSRCDEGPLPGCRIGVHRALGPGSHLYTTDLAAAMTAPFTVEAANYFHIYANEAPGTTAVYLCKKGNGKFFITSSPICEVLNIAGKLLGYWSTAARCGGLALYRLRHDMLGDHFYTLNDAEARNAVDMYGYQLEGIAGYVWLSP